MKQRADRSHRGVRHQAPTLIGCLVVKEPQRPALPSLPPRRFRCSRETRLCRAFSVSSTVCRRFFICRQRPFLPRHQPLPPRKPLPTLPWQRASCCEGANIRTNLRALQYVCHEQAKHEPGSSIQTVDRKGNSASRSISFLAQ